MNGIDKCAVDILSNTSQMSTNEISGHTIGNIAHPQILIYATAVQYFSKPCLSNDPDKNCSIFYCSAAIHFPHVETVVFSDQEFINQWKAGL